MARCDVVVADADQCAVVEQGDEHQHQHGHLEEGRPLLIIRQVVILGWLVLAGPQRKHGDEEENQKLQGKLEKVFVFQDEPQQRMASLGMKMAGKKLPHATSISMINGSIQSEIWFVKNQTDRCVRDFQSSSGPRISSLVSRMPGCYFAVQFF